MNNSNTYLLLKTFQKPVIKKKPEMKLPFPSFVHPCVSLLRRQNTYINNQKNGVETYLKGASLLHDEAQLHLKELSWFISGSNDNRKLLDKVFIFGFDIQQQNIQTVLVQTNSKNTIQDSSMDINCVISMQHILILTLIILVKEQTNCKLLLTR